jgi:tRNA(adenine34) deaminase
LKVPRKTKADEIFMRQALAEAEKSWKKGEIPVGAVLVREGKVFSRGHNESLSQSDPTAHAEVTALRKAGRKSKNYRLPDCDLYVTLEPCAMCLGAVVQARIRRLVYGAADPKAGAVRSMMRFPFARTNHRPELRGGILAGECGQVLSGFFRAKRKRT